MTAQAAVAAGRRAAEALMTDACQISRVTGTTTNPDTGVVTTTTATVYAGKCRLQQRAGTALRAEVGEASVLLTRLELHVPWGTAGVAAEQHVTVTAAADPALVGAKFTVRGPLTAKSYATAQRWELEEVTG